MAPRGLTLGAVVALAAVTALQGCGPGPAVVPAPRLLLPSQGDGVQATDVQIRGERFHPVIRSNFQSAGESRIEDQFRAFLHPGGNGDPSAAIELAPVRFVSTEQLTARLPAGLARGVYDLSVVSPSGATGTLASAYRVVTAAENVSAFQFEPIPEQRQNIPFEVGITAVDMVGRVVDGFSGTADLASRGGAVTPAQTPPFVLGRTRVTVTVPRVAGAEALIASWQGKSSSSVDFAVRPPVAVTLGFASVAAAVAAGTCSPQLAVEVRGADGAPTQVEAATAVALSTAAAGVTFHLQPGCGDAAVSSVSIPAGQGTGRFHFLTARSGTVAIRVDAPALVSARQAYTVNPGPAVALAFSSAPQVVGVGGCSGPVAVEVRDVHGNAAQPVGPLAVSLSATPSAEVSLYSDPACSSPAGSVQIASTAGAAFHFRSSRTGAVTLTAFAPSQPGLGTVAQDQQVVTP
jgi:hypothetical protein